MTTVAWDKKILCSDILATRGCLAVDKIDKIFKCEVMISERQFDFFSFCGKQSDIIAVKRWLDSGGKLSDYPIDDDETDVIFTGSGCAIHFEGNCKGNYNNINGKFSIGSGSQLALAAMDFGKNAIEAVKYAATRDICTSQECTFTNNNEIDRKFF